MFFNGRLKEALVLQVPGQVGANSIGTVRNGVGAVKRGATCAANGHFASLELGAMLRRVASHAPDMRQIFHHDSF